MFSGTWVGQVEGRKDRPCAIVVALESPQKGPRTQVVVVHNLGVDDERSWVVLDEFNVFTWPGFDLRPIKGGDGRVDFGFLPPRFFDSLIEKIKELRREGNLKQITRDE